MPRNPNHTIHEHSSHLSSRAESSTLASTGIVCRFGWSNANEPVLSAAGGEMVEFKTADSSAAAATPLQQARTVSPELAFEERVERGHYGWRNSDLTEERFPVTSDQCGERALRLFHFARSVSSDEAIRLIRKAGFEPARTGDILVFGEHFPDSQRRFPIIGLGSVAEVDLKLSVPALWFDGERRTLDVISYDGDWHRNYRFLGVRRISC